MQSPHDGTHVSCKIPSTSSKGQILRWIQTISVYHEIAVGKESEREKMKITKDINFGLMMKFHKVCIPKNVLSKSEGLRKQTSQNDTILYPK